MDKQKTATQTQSGDLWTAAARLANSRSLLDLAAEYILSGQEDRTDGEKLDTVLYAIEKARDEARAAEDEVGNYNPYRQMNARERALEAENAAIKARLIELERDKGEAWREARAEAKAYQLQRAKKKRGACGQNEAVETLLTEYLNADHSGDPLNDALHEVSSKIDGQIEAGTVDMELVGEYELAATRAGFYAGFYAGFSAGVAATG